MAGEHPVTAGWGLIGVPLGAGGSGAFEAVPVGSEGPDLPLGHCGRLQPAPDRFG